MTTVRYDNLYWGKRETGMTQSLDRTHKVLEKDGRCEVFRGNMEFGPRALCNTTMLAYPTMENVEAINAENGRDTVMPMAPVVTMEFAEEMFEDIEKTPRSKHFMIIAYDFKHMYDSIRGAAHYDSDRNVYTGRIQVSMEPELTRLLEKHNGILLNTSLNAHGQPIIYDNTNYGIMKQIQNNVRKGPNNR
jgi:carbamoyltransferase